MTYWYDLKLQPEPWAVGPLSTRKNSSGGRFPFMGKNVALETYKEAIREALRADQSVHMLEGPLRLTVFYWRKIETYTLEKSGRKSRTHEADVTNLNKALEDALHGIFYDNDVVNVIVTGVMVRQDPDTESRIIIGIEEISKDEPFRMLNELVPPEVLIPDDEPTLLDDPDEARWHPPTEDEGF